MSNPVVLVTGAKSGFGLCIAQSFAREGWRVFATSRDPQPASGSLPFDLLPLDVTSDTSAAECTKELRRRSATLDVLVNNAGIGIVGRRKKRPWKRQGSRWRPTFSAS